MDINKVKITVLQNKYQNFSQCSSKFLKDKYELFQNCYIKKCEDPRFQRMASKLDEKYILIKKGYQNIMVWWDIYLKNICGLENTLSQNGSNTITEENLQTYISKNIVPLKAFEDKISTILSPSLIKDVSYPVSSFSQHMTFFTTSSINNLGTNIGINTAGSVNSSKNGFSQTNNRENTNINDVASQAFENTFNVKGTNATFSNDAVSALSKQAINKQSENIKFAETETKDFNTDELKDPSIFYTVNGATLAAALTSNGFHSELSSNNSKSKEQAKNENSNTDSQNAKKTVNQANNTEQVIDDSTLAGIVNQNFKEEDWGRVFNKNCENAKMMSEACEETIKYLEEQRDNLEKKFDSFLIGNGYNLKTEFYMPGDNIESIKALTPEEYENTLLTSINYEIPDPDPEIGYNIVKRKEKARKKAEEYAIKFNEAFEKQMGMTYEEYKLIIQSINQDIATIKSSKYAFDQQVKSSPYIAIMYSEEFIKYKETYNPKEEYKLQRVGLFKKEDTVRYCSMFSEEFSLYNSDLIDSSLSNTKIKSYERYTLLTDDEKALYSFLYDNKGYKEAENYIEAIEDTLNNRQGLKEATDFINGISDKKITIDYKSATAGQDFFKALEQIDVGDKWNSFFSTAGKGFGDGLENFGEGIANILQTEGMISTNQYAQMYILQGFKKEWLLSGTYEISTSAGNMAPAIALGAVATLAAGPAGYGLSAQTAATVGSTAGYVSTGFSVFGNAKNQALVNGNSLASSTLYATFSGVSEVALGKLLGNIGILNENASFTLKQILNEGVEEGLQEFVDAGLRAALLEEDIQVNQLLGDSGKSFLYGVIMSAITTGGQQTIRVISENRSYTINSAEAIELLEIINNNPDMNQEQIVVNYLNNTLESKNTENIYTPFEVTENASFEEKAKKFGINMINSLKDTGSKIALESVSLNETATKISSRLWQNTKTNTSKVMDIANDQLKSTQAKISKNIQNIFTQTKNVMQEKISQVAENNSKVNLTEKVMSSNEMVDQVKNKIADVLEVDITPENSIGDTFDLFADNLNTNIKELLHLNIDIPQTFIGLFYAPFNVLAKLVYTPVKKNSKISQTIVEEGIYHMTSLDSANKILESGYVKASGMLSSYGNKKAFFFAGMPEFSKVALNTSGFLEKSVAVKFKVSENELNNFRYRSLNDQAVTVDGNYLFDKANASIVYLGLVNENGKLVYKEISENEYNNYRSDIPTDFLSRQITNLEASLSAIAGEGRTIIHNVENVIESLHKNEVIKKASKSLGNIKNKVKTNLENISDQLEIQQILKSLNKIIENKLDDTTASLVEKYNELLDSDPRLQEIIVKADRQEKVAIPKELLNSYMELRNLEFKILNPESRKNSKSTINRLKDFINGKIVHSIQSVLKSNEWVNKPRNTKKYELDISDVAEEIKPWIQEYMESGSLSEELGKQLEEWFFDENYIMGLHAMGMAMYDENGRNIIGDSILKKGLSLTGNLETGVTKELSDNVFLVNKQNKFSYALYLKNLFASSYYKADGEGGAVIVRIPKEDINNINKLTEYIDGQPYLKKEYIMGYVNSSKGNLSELITLTNSFTSDLFHTSAKISQQYKTIFPNTKKLSNDISHEETIK